MAPKVNIISEQDATQTLRGCDYSVLMQVAHDLFACRKYGEASAVYDAAYARWQLGESDVARDHWAKNYEKRTSAECVEQFGTPF